MEDETMVWLAGLGIAGFLVYEYFSGTTPVVATIPVTNVSTGTTSNSITVPVTSTTVPTPTNQTASIVQAASTITPQGSVTNGISQADIIALINSPVMTSLTSTQQTSMTNAQLQQFSANQQRLLAASQAKLSSGLPNVIDPMTASAFLQIPQTVIDNMKMGTAIGTAFGTYSLQPSGFITVDKVDPNAEAALVKLNVTWKQYKGLSGLSGLSGFLRTI